MLQMQVFACYCLRLWLRALKIPLDIIGVAIGSDEVMTLELASSCPSLEALQRYSCEI